MNSLVRLAVVPRAVLVEQLLRLVANHPDPRDFRAVVGQPPDGGADAALDEQLEVGPQLVVLANLHAGQVQALLETSLEEDLVAARRGRADLRHVRESGRPAHQLVLPDDRRDDHLVECVRAADVRVVVEVVVALGEAHLRLVVVLDHPLDHPADRVHVDDQPVRKRDSVAGRRVEPEDQLAELTRHRRRGHEPRHLVRVHHDLNELRVQDLEPDRVLGLEVRVGLVVPRVRDDRLPRLELLLQGLPGRCAQRLILRPHSSRSCGTRPSTRAAPAARRSSWSGPRRSRGRAGGCLAGARRGSTRRRRSTRARSRRAATRASRQRRASHLRARACGGSGGLRRPRDDRDLEEVEPRLWVLRGAAVDALVQLLERCDQAIPVLRLHDTSRPAT